MAGTSATLVVQDNHHLDGEVVNIRSTLPLSILSLSIKQSPKKRREKTCA